MRGALDQASQQTASANGQVLIANETHSREELSDCEHSTYKILIANEFHLQKSHPEPHFWQISSLPNFRRQHSLTRPKCAFFSATRQGLRTIALSTISALISTGAPFAVACAQTEVTPAPASAKPAPTNSSDALTIEFYSTRVRFNDDGTGERQLEVRIRPGNEQGVQELRTLSFQYNSDFESFGLLYLRVKKAGGTVIEGKPDALKDTPIAAAKEAPAFSDIRDVRITPPPLAPGDTLSYEVVAKIVKSAAPGEFWYSHSFLSGVVASDEELRIEVPSARAIHIHWAPQFAPAITTQDSEKIYLWKRVSAANPSAAKSKDSDSRTQSKPSDVSLTSFANWPAVGKWMATEEHTAATVTPGITDKTQALISSEKTDLDKSEALYDFVSKQIHLARVDPEAFEYQVRGAAKVLSSGYGDAFDKCALLVAMLSAAGIHAHIALLPSNGAVDADFPTPAVLTHAIVSVALNKDTVWLDPTEPTMPFRLLTPNLRSKQALVASTAVAPHFDETPSDPPFLSTQRVDISGRASSLGIYTARVQYTLRGDNEYALRMAFYTAPKEQWKQLAQTMATLDGLRGEVVSVNPSDPTATRDPFVLDFTLTDPEFLDWSQKQFVLALPFPTFGMPESPVIASKPVILGSPLDVTAKLTLRLPVTDSARAPAGAAAVRDYAEYHSSYNAQDNVVTAERSLRFLKHEVPPARVEDYAAFSRAIQNDESQGISVTNIIPDIPNDASANELMVAGGAALKSRRFSNALRLFRRAEELDPKQPGLWNDLGLVQLQLGEFSDAEISLRKQIAANPSDASANSLLGVALFDQKKYDEAAAAFEKQVTLKPLDASAYSSLGAAYIEQQKFQEAATQLEKAAALAPGDAGIQVKLGEADLSLNDSQAALKAFDKAEAISPAAAVENEIAFSLAQHNVALDRAQKFAHSALEKTEALLSSLRLNRVTAEQVQAITDLAPIWDTLGWVYFHQNDLDKAESFIAPAWRLDQSGDVASHLGQIYEKRGEKALAIRLYTLALAAGYTSGAAQGRLQKLSGAAPKQLSIRLARVELIRTRTIPLGKSPAGKKASFVILLEPGTAGPVVREAKFLAGDEGLSELSERLRFAKFPKIFPDGSKARIALRGDVTCASGTHECKFVYQPPSELLAGR